ncbi:MAG: hypothetical protein A2Z20_02990 [Bdellovibrionales bacterium RBG_16_40_8]|nr:MAG: hypothetical protein A2Z20_02990 [Bdellovibrionales bacterium RBG_16_40_8]
MPVLSIVKVRITFSVRFGFAFELIEIVSVGAAHKRPGRAKPSNKIKIIKILFIFNFFISIKTGSF